MSDPCIANPHTNAYTACGGPVGVPAPKGAWDSMAHSLASTGIPVLTLLAIAAGIVTIGLWLHLAAIREDDANLERWPDDGAP